MTYLLAWDFPAVRAEGMVHRAAQSHPREDYRVDRRRRRRPAAPPSSSSYIYFFCFETRSSPATKIPMIVMEMYLHERRANSFITQTHTCFLCFLHLNKVDFNFSKILTVYGYEGREFLKISRLSYRFSSCHNIEGNFCQSAIEEFSFRWRMMRNFLEIFEVNNI